ncbi:MAG: hypothetical protein JWO88_3623 [Frankiales bacterium]|nr:hypothetical protein [Frankiales bacterium]
MNGSARLPYVVGDLSTDAYDARLLSLSPRDVRRCIQALEWFITSHADVMIACGADAEVARYEDLMYRCMGVPEENMPSHAAGRADDRGR